MNDSDRDAVPRMDRGSCHPAETELGWQVVFLPPMAKGSWTLVTSVFVFARLAWTPKNFTPWTIPKDCPWKREVRTGTRKGGR